MTTLTKETLVSLLESTYSNHTEPELLNTELYNSVSLKTYNINCKQVIGNGVRIFNLIFYVFGEGTPTEEAYFNYDSEPEELKTA